MGRRGERDERRERCGKEKSRGEVLVRVEGHRRAESGARGRQMTCERERRERARDRECGVRTGVRGAGLL